ncbi:DUF7344 domain-containing protein [Natrialbaceae archaeon AArc-T1-2]|uniref:DUF7344 domain-containing protein n=1 Tax=Natrialbaceae archaeon AArc-T1-2 TaxID=3053904 RepID=UPI00255B2762|nr:hypothetical protein [Natrialbaceae archaeon AArc-T1-2]WIV66181.1 hypothetical protein QQ977_10810 [Natrialbaceae archaeon AArc-T1-2]
MTDETLTQAKLFDVFSNARRRQTVRYLKRNRGSCDLAPLVEQVAAWENDVAPEDVTRTQRRRVYISLYQTHLPMLEDHGIVNWDVDSHTIELLPDPALFEPYLDRNVGTQRDWHTLYASITVGGVFVFTLAALSVGPLSAATAPLVAVAISIAILVVAAVHHTARRPDAALPLPVPFR